MTVKDLINIFDPNGDMSIDVQLVIKDGEWDQYDVLHSDSAIIDYIKDKKIVAAAAITEDVIRIEIKWD